MSDVLAGMLVGAVAGLALMVATLMFYASRLSGRYWKLYDQHAAFKEECFRRHWFYDARVDQPKDPAA